MDYTQYSDSELTSQVRINRVRLTENADVIFFFSNGISATVPAHKLLDFAMDSAVEFTFPESGFN